MKYSSPGNGSTVGKILRPTRTVDIRRELDTHPGREYSIDMIHHALGYKEYERQATQQALLLMERQSFIKRVDRGRYMSVKAASPVRSTEPDTIRDKMLAATVREGTAAFATAEEVTADPIAQALMDPPEPEPVTYPVSKLEANAAYGKMVDEAIAERPAQPDALDTVKVIGRSKDGWWIGMGTDSTVYKMEEL